MARASKAKGPSPKPKTDRDAQQKARVLARREGYPGRSRPTTPRPTTGPGSPGYIDVKGVGDTPQMTAEEINKEIARQNLRAKKNKRLAGGGTIVASDKPKPKPRSKAKKGSAAGKHMMPGGRMMGFDSMKPAFKFNGPSR